MTYIVKFRDEALKEWHKLDKTIQQQFAKKLKNAVKIPILKVPDCGGSRMVTKLNYVPLVFASCMKLLMVFW